MENIFDIETLATISSSKKERIDGESSISNQLGMCFVANLPRGACSVRWITCLRGVILFTRLFHTFCEGLARNGMSVYLHLNRYKRNDQYRMRSINVNYNHIATAVLPLNISRPYMRI